MWRHRCSCLPPNKRPYVVDIATNNVLKYINLRLFFNPHFVSLPGSLVNLPSLFSPLSTVAPAAYLTVHIPGLVGLTMKPIVFICGNVPNSGVNIAIAMRRDAILKYVLQSCPLLFFLSFFHVWHVFWILPTPFQPFLPAACGIT